MSKSWWMVGLLVYLLPLRWVWASYDEFGDASENLRIDAKSYFLEINGEIELEWHDLEGKGGPGYDSPTDTRTLGTRSPFVEIDSFWLSLRLSISEHWGIYSILDFNPQSADVAAVWADGNGRFWGLNHHVELGYHEPIVKIDRRTERYPLVATMYWRAPEFHGAYELSFQDQGWLWEAGLSVAMMRPLDLAGVQESTSQSGTINVLSYGTARTFSGIEPIYGGRIKGGFGGFYLEAFGFKGALSAQGGTDVLRSAFPYYRDLDGYDEAQEGSDDLYWYGGRVGWDYWGIHVLVEGIFSREALIKRRGGYGELSYLWILNDNPQWYLSFEPLFRTELTQILDSDCIQHSGQTLRSTAPINGVSWDYRIQTMALIAKVYRPFLTFRLEHYWIDEINGVPALNIADEPIRNDEWLFQAEVRF